MIIVAVGLLAAGTLWLHEQSKPVVRASRPLSASRGPRSIHASGVVEGGSRNIDLRMQVAGRVEQVLVNEGDRVEAGQALICLDDLTQRHEVERLAAELQYAMAKLDRLKNGAHEQEIIEAQGMHAARLARLQHAEAEWERAKRLSQSKAIGEQEVARWEADVRAFSAEVVAAKAKFDLLTSPPRQDELQAAEAKVHAARAQLQLAQTELDRTRLKAPAAGQILEIHREVGELIDLRDPQPVLVMADMRRKRVRAYVEELDALHVVPGMVASITVDGIPGHEFTGEVVEVMPRMSFKQIWTDRPDERFDMKTREVLLDVREDVSDVGHRLSVQAANRSHSNTATMDGTAQSHQAALRSTAVGALVFGLIVEVEILPAVPTEHVQAAHLRQ
jgi:multidrug resistance efflux pump